MTSNNFKLDVTELYFTRKGTVSQINYHTPSRA